MFKGSPQPDVLSVVQKVLHRDIEVSIPTQRPRRVRLVYTRAKCSCKQGRRGGKSNIVDGIRGTEATRSVREFEVKIDSPMKKVYWALNRPPPL